MQSLILPQKDTDLVVLLVIVKVGGVNEKKRYAGLSHVLEHMMFRGSKNYPTNKDIFGALTKIGAEFNAYTMQDQTGYHIKVFKDDIDVAMAVLSDMLKNSLMRKEDLVKEKTVVLEEINAEKNDPRGYCQELFEINIFGDHPLSNSVGGTKKSIEGIDIEIVKKFYKKYYCAENSILVLTGDISIKKGDGLIKKYFGKGWEGGGGISIGGNVPRMLGGGNGIRIFNSKGDGDQDHICIGFPIDGFVSNKKYTYELLNVILGGNMASRLYLRLREQLGMVYNVKSHVVFFEKQGYFVVCTWTDNKNIYKVVKNIKNVLDDVANKGIDENELKEAKKFLKGNGYIKTADLMSLAMFFGLQVLYNRDVMLYNQYLEQVMQVSPKDISECAKGMIKWNKGVISLVGNVDKRKIEKIF